MSLLPSIPIRESGPRFSARLIDSSWIVLDGETGGPLNQARYTVEIQARWTAEAMEMAYQKGLLEGRQSKGTKIAQS